MLRPFQIAVPEADVDDLNRRLQSARWPDQLPGAGWSLGMDHDVLRGVVDRWRDGFDWRAHEAWLNEHPSYLHEVGEDRTPRAACEVERRRSVAARVAPRLAVGGSASSATPSGP